jgi:hypothetical protein
LLPVNHLFQEFHLLLLYSQVLGEPAAHGIECVASSDQLLPPRKPRVLSSCALLFHAVSPGPVHESAAVLLTVQLNDFIISKVLDVLGVVLVPPDILRLCLLLQLLTSTAHLCIIISRNQTYIVTITVLPL